MKIAHINMFYLPTFGGVEQVMYELAKRQVSDGHEVHVFCCDSDKNNRIEKKEEVIEGVFVHRVPYIFRLSLSTHIWPGLKKLFVEVNEKISGFDVIHSHVSGHLYVYQAGKFAQELKIPHIHTTHCPWTDYSFRPKVLWPMVFLNDLFFNKKSFERIDKVIAITPWELDFVKKFSPEEKIKVIPNGMDGILYKKITKNNFKKKYEIKGKKMVLYFGRLNPTKAPEKFAEAAINLTKSGSAKNISFVWVGPDEGMGPIVSEMIKSYPNMHYIGPIRGKENVAEMYQAADVYVLPSYREGLPLTLFEAMASGLPIIASPVNGIPYEMSEPENGFFVEYGNVEKLQEKILQILNEKELANKISENNMKKAKNYDWDIIYGKYMDEYNFLINASKNS